MSFRTFNIPFLLSASLLILSCDTENIQRTFTEEMEARKCTVQTYDPTTPSRGIDRASLLKRYSDIPYFGFHKGYMIVVLNGKMGIIDTLGREIIEPFYKDISRYPEGEFLIGSMDSRSKEKDFLYIGDDHKVYTCKCQSVQRSYSGFIRIEVGGNYGLLDSLGRELLPAKYRVIYGIGENGLVSAYSDEGGGIVNLENKVIVPFKYSRVWSFGSRNVAPIENSDGKWAIVDDLGDFKTSFIYDNISPYSQTNTATVTQGTKKGLLDQFGDLITPFKYDTIWNYSGSVKKVDQGYHIPVNLNSKWGVLTSTGKELVAPVYDKKVDLPLPTTVSRDGLWTFINEEGDEVVPANFEEVLFPENKIVGIKKDGKWGFISSDGTLLSDHVYDNFYSSSKAKYSFVTQNKKHSAVNTTGKVFITDVDSLKINFQGTQYGFTAYKHGKWGVLDSLGKESIPFEFEDLGLMRFKNGFAKKGNKYGIISFQNTNILPFEYDYIGEFQKSDSYITAPIRLNNKWGRVDIDGKISEPITHDRYEEISWE